MAQNVTFEQFLHHTNAEEIIVKKMKEAGSRIYELNYDRRFKHCKVLYRKFYDVKLRDSVLNYGLVLKPMPNVFKAKFIQFPQNNNNEGDYMTTDGTENNSDKKRRDKTPNIEDKYKNDLPSTSSAFVQKPRLISPSEKNKNEVKIKSKPESKQKSYTRKDKTAFKTTKSVSKRRISVEKPKSSNKSKKITNYFPSNVEEETISNQNVKLRKRISDASNENIEIEPQAKLPKMSSPTNKKLRVLNKNKIDPLSSKTNSNGKNNGEIKGEHKSDEYENSLHKKANNSDDIVSDDCDIKSNNSVVNVTSEDSKKQLSPMQNIENYHSPLKSKLPKRNRTEEYEKVLDIISKKLLKEISPEKSAQAQAGYKHREIQLWIKEGQEALEESEDNNLSIYTETRALREDVCLEYKLQTIKENPERVRKYIKYWLNFKIQMRKGMDLEDTVVCETSKDKILSAFSQMTFDDFKSLINIQKYKPRWTTLGKSVNELEDNFNNLYISFIHKEKPWPEVHIELSRLQSYLFSKGIKGPIPLKNIPPRILSFDEVLEKTNMKECISLSCDKPPESFKELLSLCKNEYEKCCYKGVWTEELKFVEEGESSQELSIELLTEPAISMSPLKVTSDSGNNQQNVMDKELPEVQILNRSDVKLEIEISHTCKGDEPTTHESIIKTKQLSDFTSQLSEMDKVLTPSPNIFTSSDENNPSKCSNTDNIGLTFKDIESAEKGNVIPPSPNIFHSSGESNSKTIDPDLIQVETQESVYVPCESDNNFHTEQNNFSITMNKVSESEDPFGEVNETEEETGVIILDISSSTDISELVLENTTTSTTCAKVPAQETLSCEEVLGNHLHQSHSQLSMKTITSDSHLDLSGVRGKTAEKAIDSEKNIAPEKRSLLCQTTISPSSAETNINQKKIEEPRSTEKLSVPLVDEVNMSQPNTDEANLTESVSNKENEISVAKEQSEPVKILKNVVKREIFSQHSQYCDDVEIIEVPQSEAMVIDDEETAPELLEALLCNSSRNEVLPFTTVHTTISHQTSSLYLNNFPQAQQFPSNFDITQSQTNLKQSSNHSTNVTSRKACTKYPGITIQNLDKDCDSINYNEFKTPQNQTANINCFSSTVMNKSCSLPVDAQGITCKKQLNYKQKESNEKPSFSPILKGNRQLSEEMSETSLVSIAPQNFPSDIEFSQTSLNKFLNETQKNPSEISVESEKQVEKSNSVEPICTTQYTNFVENTSGQTAVPLVVCLGESFDENNKTCMNLEQSNFMVENIITEKNIKSNEMQKLSPPKQSIDQELKLSNKNTVEQLSDIEEETEEHLVDTLAKDSLDESSDVQLLEESTEDDDVFESEKLQAAVKHVLKIKKNSNITMRRRTLSEQLQPISVSTRTSSFSQPSVVYDFEKAPLHSPKSNLQSKCKKIEEITKSDSKPATTKNHRTISLEGFIPFDSLKNITTTNEDYVGVPMIMLEKRYLSILSSVCNNSEFLQNNALQDRIPLKITIDLKIPECKENPISIDQNVAIPLIARKELTVQENFKDKNNALLNKPSPKQTGYKAEKKMPSTSTKKTTPKKPSKPSDFVQQKTHAFSSIPLKPCYKTVKNKPHSILAVEECDYLIEDASQQSSTATISQILGTDCTYFENSELLRNVDHICIPHHPEVPELKITQLPPQVPTPMPPTTSKVINLKPITLSEGVTARKVWQVNLQWKSQNKMSIEVRFSFNRHSMTACDDSAKLLFNFPSEIWSDIHRVLREIDRFEYKRRALKSQQKTTSLHKVLGQLFSSSTQIVEVKLINDFYNPFIICEKTIPVHRKPFQCLTKGINPEILSKIKFVKENLQKTVLE